MQEIAGETNTPVHSVVFNGAAANAERVWDRVNTVTAGRGLVMQPTHRDDLIGTFFGGNEPTGGEPSNLRDTHGSYGPSVDAEDRLRVWGTAEVSILNACPPL